MNTLQNSRLLHLVKQKYSNNDNFDECDNLSDWEYIADTLNVLGSTKTSTEWRDEWRKIKKAAHNKYNDAMIFRKENPGKELPSELKLTEEDHRVINVSKTCATSEVLRMLDCGAVSPFEVDDSSEIDDSDAQDIEPLRFDDSGDNVKTTHESNFDELEEGEEEQGTSENNKILNQTKEEPNKYINELIKEKAEKMIAVEQLEEQKKINSQLEELLAMLQGGTQLKI